MAGRAFGATNVCRRVLWLRGPQRDFPNWRELKVRKERAMRQGVALGNEKFGSNLMFDDRFFVSLSPKIQS